MSSVYLLSSPSPHSYLPPVFLLRTQNFFSLIPVTFARVFIGRAVIMRMDRSSKTSPKVQKNLTPQKSTSQRNRFTAVYNCLPSPESLHHFLPSYLPSSLPFSLHLSLPSYLP